jgi:hypothetical protein
MTYKTYQTKRFIAGFNFPDPDWDSLPPNFPNVPKTGLTREESYLLEGIILAWTANAGGWKKGVARSAHIGLVCLIGLISFIGLIGLISSGSESLTSTVNAAGTAINEIVESTASAILKR